MVLGPALWSWSSAVTVFFLDAGFPFDGSKEWTVIVSIGRALKGLLDDYWLLSTGIVRGYHHLMA